MRTAECTARPRGAALMARQDTDCPNYLDRPSEFRNLDREAMQECFVRVPVPGLHGRGSVRTAFNYRPAISNLAFKHFASNKLVITVYYSISISSINKYRQSSR